MNHKILDKNYQDEIKSLFVSVFTASEGEQEGKLIGNLASELSSEIDNQEIVCLGAFDDETLIGSILFTRLLFKENINVYLLAPVAVSTEHQGKGVGKSLINYGLEEMRNRSVSVVVTYGDPAFYSKVGFNDLSTNVIQAPLKLSMPFGWLGQSLTGESILTIHDRPKCVKAFNNPVYW